MKNGNWLFLIGVGFAATAAFNIAAGMGWGYAVFAALLSVGFFMQSAGRVFGAIMAEQLAAKTDEREARAQPRTLTARAS